MYFESLLRMLQNVVLLMLFGCFVKTYRNPESGPPEDRNSENSENSEIQNSECGNVNVNIFLIFGFGPAGQAPPWWGGGLTSVKITPEHNTILQRVRKGICL